MYADEQLRKHCHLWTQLSACFTKCFVFISHQFLSSDFIKKKIPNTSLIHSAFRGYQTEISESEFSDLFEREIKGNSEGNCLESGLLTVVIRIPKTIIIFIVLVEHTCWHSEAYVKQNSHMYSCVCKRN